MFTDIYCLSVRRSCVRRHRVYERTNDYALSSAAPEQGRQPALPSRLCLRPMKRSAPKKSVNPPLLNAVNAANAVNTANSPVRTVQAGAERK